MKWKKVGKVREAHGLRGDLAILIFSGEIAWLKELKTFCLAKENSNLLSGDIFEIERAKPYKEGLLIKPKGINDRNQAEALRGFFFGIPEDLLVAEEGESLFLGEILGFQVLDRGQLVGEITDFSSNGPQDLLVVRREKKSQVEIPFVENFILKIDFENKQILMDLPEGLLDLQESGE